MKNLILVTLLLLILGGYKASKPVSDVRKEVNIRARPYTLEIEKRYFIDTTGLGELLSGRIIMKPEKETGITLQHKISGNTLTTEVVVPAVRKEITLADTTIRITNTREVVTEEQKSIGEKLSDHFSFFCLGHYYIPES